MPNNIFIFTNLIQNLLFFLSYKDKILSNKDISKYFYYQIQTFIPLITLDTSSLIHKSPILCFLPNLASRILN